MERSRRQEFLKLKALRQGLLPDRVLDAWLGNNGRSELSSVCQVFGQNLNVLMPTAVSLRVS
jgi:hypothetical protein